MRKCCDCTGSTRVMDWISTRAIRPQRIWPLWSGTAPAKSTAAAMRRYASCSRLERLFRGIPPMREHDLKLIRSRENPRFKALRQLATSTRERRKAGLALLDGAHLICAYRASGGVPEQLILSESGAANAEAARLAGGVAGQALLVLADSLFNEVAQVATPTGIVALIRTPQAGPLPDKIERCVMLENIQDAGNLGSILRSTAAAGISTVLLSQGCAFALSPKGLRAGMGAHFCLELF